MLESSTPNPAPLVPPPLPPPLPKPKPRVWTALVVGIVSLIATLIVSGLVTVAALIAIGGFNLEKPTSDSASMISAMDKVAGNLTGVALLVLPAQFTMLCAALGAAFLSPEKLKDRLGYILGFCRWWILPFILLGTFFTGIASGLAAEALFVEESASLRMFIAMARIPDQAQFVGVLLLLSVVPAVVEESLFRGYIQRRLLQRWSPLAAICTSTAFFALAHFDVQHTLGVIPLGLWLGYLAWRTGALWPGMICHAVQNVFALLASRYDDPTVPGLPPELVPVLIVTGLGLLASVIFLQRIRFPVVPASDAVGP
jgi:CAAX protease family protein